LDKVESDVYALIDTGATNTSISDTLAVSLGLEIIERYKVEAAGGVHTANGYAVDVMLRNMVSFTNIHVAEFVRNGKFDIIIGMDILTQGDLAITMAGLSYHSGFLLIPITLITLQLPKKMTLIFRPNEALLSIRLCPRVSIPGGCKNALFSCEAEAL
jgi:hypothetical protein